MEGRLGRELRAAFTSIARVEAGLISGDADTPLTGTVQGGLGVECPGACPRPSAFAARSSTLKARPKSGWAVGNQRSALPGSFKS